MTAAHVVEQVSDEDGEGVLEFVDHDNSWIGVRIVEHEKHPSEDIAILKLDGRNPRQSWMVLSDNSRFQSCKYDCWDTRLILLSSQESSARNNSNRRT